MFDPFVFRNDDGECGECGVCGALPVVLLLLPLPPLWLLLLLTTVGEFGEDRGETISICWGEQTAAVLRLLRLSGEVDDVDVKRLWAEEGREEEGREDEDVMVVAVVVLVGVMDVAVMAVVVEMEVEEKEEEEDKEEEEHEEEEDAEVEEEDEGAFVLGVVDDIIDDTGVEKTMKECDDDNDDGEVPDQPLPLLPVRDEEFDPRGERIERPPLFTPVGRPVVLEEVVVMRLGWLGLLGLRMGMALGV